MNNTIPKVSILINCYNSEKYLQETLDSVAAQTYTDWEIVLVDNCSTDRTSAIVNAFPGNLLYYKTEKNISLGAARNFGLQYCRCKYLAFLDSDDLWLPEKLEKQVGLMDNGDYGFCYTGVYEIDEKSRVINELYPIHKTGKVFRDLLIEYDVRMLTALVRMDYLKENAILFEDCLFYSIDYNLFLRLAFGCDVLIIPEILAKYRVHGENLTYKLSHKWSSEMVYTLQQLERVHSGEIGGYHSEMDHAYVYTRFLQFKHFLIVKDRKNSLRVITEIRDYNRNYYLYYLILRFFPLEKFWDLIVKNKQKLQYFIYKLRKLIG